MARRHRRKTEEEDGNLERWLVSYADFVTLLFAFFVVMYSISSVNEGKYRVLSDTLNAVFEETTRSIDPIQVGEVARSPVSSGDNIPLDTKLNNSAINEIPEDTATGSGEGHGIDEKLEQVLLKNIDDEQIEIIREGNRIEVRMNSKMLFPSASARLSPKALAVLKKIASVVKDARSMVHVEGHTDNVPIGTVSFPSNWELSAARAASVVHFLNRQNIAPQRLAAVGYGEHKPIADNKTAAGRQKNRRVSLVLLPMKKSDSTLDDIIQPGEVVPWAEGPAVE